MGYVFRSVFISAISEWSKWFKVIPSMDLFRDVCTQIYVQIIPIEVFPGFSGRFRKSKEWPARDHLLGRCSQGCIPDMRMRLMMRSIVVIDDSSPWFQSFSINVIMKYDGYTYCAMCHYDVVLFDDGERRGGGGGRGQRWPWHACSVQQSILSSSQTGRWISLWTNHHLLESS